MYYKIDEIDIPLVTTGTSPFIGAGQFGRNALKWREQFLNNADAIVEILEAGYQAGAKGIEAIPVGAIMEATKIMTEAHDDYVVTGSTLPTKSRGSAKDLIDANAKLIFVHGMVSDKKDNKVLKLLDYISSEGVIPGIATHDPVPTINFCIEHSVNVKAFLIPFNAKGSMMGRSDKLVELVDKTKGYAFIGMKTLAAGKLDPKVAFEYIAKHNICAVSIGMVDKQEAIQSTKLALQALQK